jgi:hypothetical protein
MAVVLARCVCGRGGLGFWCSGGDAVGGRFYRWEGTGGAGMLIDFSYRTERLFLLSQTADLLPSEMAFNGRKCTKREKGETMNQITNGDQRNSINSKHKKRRKKGLEKMDQHGRVGPCFRAKCCGYIMGKYTSKYY